MVHTTLSRKTRFIGLALKLGVILSCIFGIYFSLIEIRSGFMGTKTMFLYFTTQSNIWIAAICLVFILIDLLQKGSRKIHNWLYVLKYMFTVSALLTFIVFTLMLSSLLPKSYLISPSNICLHNLTPILALIDFILCDYGFVSSRKHILYAAVMPLAYAIITFILSFNGVRFAGGAIVPYFYMNYEKLGWFSIGEKGIGVVYWIMIMTVIILLIGSALLKIKDGRQKRCLTPENAF